MADFQTYFTIFMLWLIPTILIKFFLKSKKAHLIPPTPFAIPIIGHLHLIFPIPHQAMHKLSLRYGPIYRLFLGSHTSFVVSTPEATKEFFKFNENAYLDRPINSATYHMTYENKDFVFAQYGAHWKFMKKIIMTELLNGGKVDLHCQVRKNEVTRFMKQISQMAKDKKALEMDLELAKVINNVIIETILGTKFSDEAEARKMKDLVDDIASLEGSFNVSDYIWFLKNVDLQGFGKRFKAVHERFDIFVEKIIKEHEKARKLENLTPERKDLLHILLDTAEDKSQKIQLTRENIKAFIFNMFVATDTTSLTMEWALSELINHPNVLKKATEEMDRVVGKDRLLQESDIPNLPYLQAIVSESWRLHPGAALIPRLATEDRTVAGYHIPANSTVFFSPWALGRDPGAWENPLEFRPERFEHMKMEPRGQDYSMLTFGAGKRMCPGYSLAYQLLHITLGSMIQCFEWKAGKDGNMTSVDMEEGVGVTLPRANRLVCLPVARLNPLPF
uniref:cytochrome P450 93A3-like n=1 Tax=Erigeron canadensis TaxID=72917 RepID=UPI001CB8B3B6|nr:cytochrome P450 93A3-like [Erigeron canadensis]